MRIIRKFYRFTLVLSFVLFAGVSKATVWFVDTGGDDSWNGLYASYISGTDGPKKTVNAALSAASSGDTIQCSSGHFTEHVIVDKDIYMFVSNTFFKALTMNAASGYLLLKGDSLNIVDTFEMLDGVIFTRGENVRLGLIPNCISLGGSSKSFVDGPYYIGHESMTTQVRFLIGDGNDYRPVTVGFNKNGHDTVYFRCMVNAASAAGLAKKPASLRNISTRHFWEVSTDRYDVLDKFLLFLSYDTVSTDDQAYEGSSLRLAWHNGIDSWVNLNGSGTGNRKGALQLVSATDSLGIFTLANALSGINSLGTKEIFARFNPPSVCVNTNAAFRDISFTKNASQNYRFWDFGVASVTTDTSSLQNPVYVYSTPGIYQVKLIVGNDEGFYDSIVKSVDIRPLPEVKFGSTNVCFGLANRFTDSSNAFSPDAVMSRLWKFGDGATAATKNANHVYAAPGVYSAKIIITSSAGCRDSLTRSVEVYAIPKPDFVAPAVCISDSAVFLRVRNTDPAENNIEWKWVFDGNTFSDSLVKYKFSSADTFDVELFGKSKFGCEDSTTKEAIVYGLPSVGFTLAAITNNRDTQCLNGNRFVLSPTINAGTGQSIANASWNWGNGTNSVLTDSSRNYSAEGDYRVVLSAETDQGCRDSAVRTFTVKGFIKPMFAKSGQCVPGIVRFQDSAFQSSNTVTGRQWFVDDTLRFTGAVYNSFITAAGPFKVTYIATNADNCMDSATRFYTFTLFPTIGLTVAPGIPFCKGDSVTITVNGGKNVLWLADNDTSRTKVFKTPQRYFVRVFNSAECYVTDDDTIIVYPDASISALRDTTIYRGGAARLRASGGVSYTWSPASGLSSTTGAAVTARPMNTMRYIVRGTNAFGCAGTDTVLVVVAEPLFVKIPNIITPNGDNSNDAWDLSQLEDYNRYEITIVDYKGDEVYHLTSGYLNDWKATDKNGKELPEGTYYYRLLFGLKDKEYKGFIQVIR